MELIKKTSLEKSDDVADTLKWKLDKIEHEGLPVESGLADYIVLASENIDNELDYLAGVKKQISEREKYLKSHSEAIKVEGASFVESMGVDKLEGAICSSVTVTKAKDSVTTETTKTILIYNESDEEIEEFLISLGKAQYSEVTETKTSNAIPAKLRINKRKVKNDEPRTN